MGIPRLARSPTAERRTASCVQGRSLTCGWSGSVPQDQFGDLFSLGQSGTPGGGVWVVQHKRCWGIRQDNENPTRQRSCRLPGQRHIGDDKMIDFPTSRFCSSPPRFVLSSSLCRAPRALCCSRRGSRVLLQGPRPPIFVIMLVMNLCCWRLPVVSRHLSFSRRSVIAASSLQQRAVCAVSSSSSRRPRRVACTPPPFLAARPAARPGPPPLSSSSLSFAAGSAPAPGRPRPGLPRC